MSNRRALSNAVKESKQPKKLSKPKDIDYNSIMGYRDDSPFRNKSSININTPTGSIDMSNTGIPLMANGRYLPPYSGTHQFNTNQVTETPLAQAKKGGGLKRKKEIQQPGQWAGVTPELVQPGNEAFELPNTPSVPAEFQTMDCPIFHKYDPNVGECVPFTEEEKAAYGLDYMKNWTQSPMHEQMLRASIEKDAPAGNIDNYVKDITDLRLRATDPNISFLPTGKDAPIGEADPYNLYDSKYTNGKKVYDPLFNSENEQDILNEKKLDTPLYLQSGVNNLNFYKSNTPNNKDLKSQAIFYTKDLPGEHAYVYPHEFSHLQDMGGGLIPASDYKTMESGVLPGTVSYNKIKEISKKYNIDSDISKNDPETYKKYLEEISDVYKKEYPKYRKYDADKKLYETDYNKYKVQRNEGDIINSPSDNSMPYEEFTQKHLANKFFTDIDERKDYIGLDTEARARLNAIRMYGKASGIYDPYTEKLTPEKYNQIQNLFNEQNPNASDANQLRQLQEVYKDEDILNMLNTISKNDTKENDTEVYTAKRGGTLKSKKYSRSLSATNKFFKEHAFFEKPKKLSKKRIYDPNSKYYQEGGELPEDYQSFLDYSATAPENRQPSENYYYMSPDEYDHYGMWEALGKPQNFEQALEMNPDWQQDEEGYYHGYSVNPYTGVFLKAGAPGLEEGDTKWMEIKDHYLSPRANTSTPVYDPELQRFKYIPKEEDGGLTQYAPGGASDGPGNPKRKKSTSEKNKIIPSWVPKSVVKVIKNSEIGINPFMSNIGSFKSGIGNAMASENQNYTPYVVNPNTTISEVDEYTSDLPQYEGLKQYGISNPSIGITTSTGLGKRKIDRNRGSGSDGFTFDTYAGIDYDNTRRKELGQVIQNLGTDMGIYHQYVQDNPAIGGGINTGEQYGQSGRKGWDGKNLRGFGRFVEKNPLIGGLSLNYRSLPIKQPAGYTARGMGKIGLDYDPANNIGANLEAGLLLDTGSKTKHYNSGEYYASINPKLVTQVGSKGVNFGPALTAEIAGVPGFLGNRFPGYFFGNASIAHDLVKRSPTISANAGWKMPLTKLSQKEKDPRIQEIEDKEIEYERERPVKPVEQKEPEEQTEWIGEHPRWLRNGGLTDNYVEIDIPKDQIQKYVDGGYIVEDISVPELNNYAEGGEADYQLGDEIDEATMKRLKKLGYTFEEI